MVRFAVNIADLTYIPSVGLLLYDFISADSQRVNTGKKLDDVSVILDGPAAADELRVLACLTFLANTLSPKYMRYPLRVYKQGPRGGWPKISAETIENEYRLQDMRR